MRMHNPPHPGEIIKSLCLEPLGVSVTEAAKALGVSRKTLSAITTAAARSPRRWRFASPSLSPRRQRAGSTSKRSSTSGTPNSRTTASRSRAWRREQDA